MKKGCRIKHSTFLTLDCSALFNTHYAKKFVSSAHWVCHKPVMFPRQKHVRVSLISCALGFSLPAQESLQGTPAVPKCIQLVQKVLMCFGSHGHAPVEDTVGICQQNPQIVLKQNFLLKRVVLVAISRTCIWSHASSSQDFSGKCL